MPDTRTMSANAGEIEQLKQQIAQLQNLIVSSGNVYHIPEPIRLLSEYSGCKKELNAFLQEVDDLYNEFKIKGENGAPDSFNALYFRAIKNKLRGEARTVVCAHGNPSTIPDLKRILLENFGDQRDFATNLNTLFHLRKGERSNTKYYSDIKELNTKLKSNLQLNPLSAQDLLEILTITKFTDGISEPLASIIRNSRPKTLEDAYQAVIINQNAEVRKPLPRQITANTFSATKPHKSTWQKPNTSTWQKPGTSTANNMHNSHKHKKPDASHMPMRQPLQQKHRAENNNTEEAHSAEEEEIEEESEEEVNVHDSDMLNFQITRRGKGKT